MEPAKNAVISKFNNDPQSDESDDETSRVKRKRIRHRLSLSPFQIRSHPTVDPSLLSSAMKIQTFTLEDALCFPGSRQIQHGICTNLVSIWSAFHYASTFHEKSLKDLINEITEIVELGEEFGNMTRDPCKTLQVTAIWKQLNEIHTKSICSQGLEPERTISTLVIRESLIIQKMLFAILAKGDYIIIINNPINWQKCIIHLTNRDISKIIIKMEQIKRNLQPEWTLQISPFGINQNGLKMDLFSLTKAY